jgi:hypothetical protein
VLGRVLKTSSPNMGEVREGETAFRWEKAIARFPHPNPPPNLGAGDLFLLTAWLGSRYRGRSTITIQPTPNLSATMPNKEAKNVFSSGICT